jgi:hypothetical protein
VVSFTPPPPYHRRNRPRHPLYTKLGGLQSRSGRCKDKKNFVPAENQTWAVQPVAIPTELFRLRSLLYQRRQEIVRKSTIIFRTYLKSGLRSRLALALFDSTRRRLQDVQFRAGCRQHHSFMLRPDSPSSLNSTVGVLILPLSSKYFDVSTHC